MRTPLGRLIVPLLLVVLALALRTRLVAPGPAYAGLVQILPWLALPAAAALGVLFNRARLCAAALGLLAAYAVLPRDAAMLPTDARALGVYSLISILMPALVLALLFTPERGLRGGHGKIVVAQIPFWLLVGWGVVAWAGAEAYPWLLAHLHPGAQPGLLLSLRALALLATAFAAGVVLLVLRGDEDTAALTGTLPFVSAALGMLDRDGMAPVMFGAAGLALVLSLLRSSHDMAFRDELTGILGRRALNERLKGLGRRYVIAMADVDHFKQFNDTYGHDVGDDVLKMVAQQIDDVGGGGIAYRYGGEEFCIVFPGRSIAQCVPHLEAVRRAVGRYRLVLRDSAQRDVPARVAKARRGRRRQPRGAESVSVTISVGVAERSGRCPTPETVVEAADAALYRAKEKGRNCVVY
jgi:diguanylate cyclase (GGDEF)-like protein